MEQENLQLEVQALVYTAERKKLETVADRLKVEHKDVSRLIVTKAVSESLEKELAKVESSEKVSLLQELKLMLSQDSSSTGKSESKEESYVFQLLASSALRRQFKINGQIGEPEQKDKLSYTSLVRQISAGVEQKYTEREIVDGIIRAITPGMVLRSYLESHKDLSLERLKKILRSHYGVKDTTELYQTLASLCQNPKETPSAFLMRALDIRQQILFACYEGETELHYDAEHVKQLFLRSVETGLLDESIRAKLRPFLKDKNVTDEVLIQQMSVAASAESERNKKLRSQSKGRLSVSVVREDVTQPSSQTKPPQDDILAAINAIKSEMKALKEEIHKPKNTRKEERKEPSRCQGCKDRNIQRCNHCFKCGSDSHFARGCRKQGNDNRLLSRDRK